MSGPRQAVRLSFAFKVIKYHVDVVRVKPLSELWMNKRLSVDCFHVRIAALLFK